MDVDVTVRMPADRVADLLCSGFEGGVGYWAEVVAFAAPESVVDLGERWRDGPYRHVHYPLSQGGAVIVRDRETSKRYRLDLDAVRRGLSVMAHKWPRHFGNWLAESDDAETGDVFIQCCLLGDIVYG